MYVKILAAANRDRVPVTVSGAGTGTVGGRVAFGGIVLATDRLNHIKSIVREEHGGHAVVEAGVILSDFREQWTRRDCFIRLTRQSTDALWVGQLRLTLPEPGHSSMVQHGITSERLTIVLASGEIVDLRRGDVRAMRRKTSRWCYRCANYPIITGRRRGRMRTAILLPGRWMQLIFLSAAKVLLG